MFQGPNDFKAQMCEVQLQYGNSTTKWQFHIFFRLDSTLYLAILFVFRTFFYIIHLTDLCSARKGYLDPYEPLHKSIRAAEIAKWYVSLHMSVSVDGFKVPLINKTPHYNFQQKKLTLLFNQINQKDLFLMMKFAWLFNN